MTSMEHDRRRRRVVIGVHTHKYVHVAVALDANGGVIDSRSFAADSGGYIQLIDRAVAFGAGLLTFAIEGTGSYGAGLTSSWPATTATGSAANPPGPGCWASHRYRPPQG